jgi:hypothetical protein
MGNWTEDLKTNNPYYEVIKKIYEILRGAVEYDNVPSQKIWRAKLKQLTNAAPTITELVNTTGVTFGVSRTPGSGSYTITGSGMFKTSSYLYTHLGMPQTASIGTSASFASLRRSGSDNYGCLLTFNTASTLVGGWDELYVEVISHV